MSLDFKALVAGYICLDILSNPIGSGSEPFKNIFLPGRQVAAGPVNCSTGGLFYCIPGFGMYLKELCQLVIAATGFECDSVKEFEHIGDRVNILCRIFNVCEGF